MPDTENLNVAVVQTSLNENQGGLASFTSALCDHLASKKAGISLITRREKDSETLILPKNKEVKCFFLGRRRKWRLFSFWDSRFRRKLEKICLDDDIGVIHTQDLWTPEVHLAAKTARNLTIPLVMSITGTLTPWSLKHRRIKKKFGWSLYQKKDLEEASVLHATCRREIEDIRRTGISNPVALIPLAVDIPRSGGPLLPASGDRTILYLSRIHRKKGLIHLVEAWAALRPRGWKVIVAGQDDDGDYREKLQKQIRELGLDRDFIFRGFVSRKEKRKLLQNAEL